MEQKFILSCCSTVDLPYAYMKQRGVPVLFYTYVVDGVEYDDDMGRDPAALPRFYQFIREGKLPQTSQINVAAYTDFFEELLQKVSKSPSGSDRFPMLLLRLRIIGGQRRRSAGCRQIIGRGSPMGTG